MSAAPESMYIHSNGHLKVYGTYIHNNIDVLSPKTDVELCITALTIITTCVIHTRLKFPVLWHR